MPLATLRHDFDAVNMPAGQLWLYVKDSGFPTLMSPGVPMHYDFDTPVGALRQSSAAR
jgi:hypothetical protein